MKTKLNILNQNLSVKIPSGIIKKIRMLLQKTSRLLNLGADINFLLVSDKAIRIYNRRYLRHDTPTDVIAFEMKEEGVLGDIVISTDTAKRQAREQRHSLEKEVTILAIHGILHLVGYRDKKKRDREKMWRKTDQLLKQIQNF